MDHELGSITPGKCADIVFLESLDTMHVTRVLIDGEVVAENGKMVVEIPHYSYPEWARHSMHVKGPVTANTFRISADGAEKRLVRVIEVIPARCV